MKRKIKKIIQISCITVLATLFVGCNPTNDEHVSQDDANATKTDKSTVENNTSTIVSDTNRSLCNYENLLLTTDNLIVNVHANSFNTTTKLLQDMNSTLKSFDKMNARVLDTIDLSMKLVNELAKPFAFYGDSSPFTLNTNFSSTVPAFAISQPLVKKYLLLSSPNRLFPENSSVKTLFSNSAELLNAWKRALNVADKSKRLYITIVEIDNNKLTNLTNGLLIKNFD